MWPSARSAVRHRLDAQADPAHIPPEGKPVVASMLLLHISRQAVVGVASCTSSIRRHAVRNVDVALLSAVAPAGASSEPRPVPTDSLKQQPTPVCVQGPYLWVAQACCRLVQPPLQEQQQGCQPYSGWRCCCSCWAGGPPLQLAACPLRGVRRQPVWAGGFLAGLGQHGGAARGNCRTCQLP